LVGGADGLNDIGERGVGLSGFEGAKVAIGGIALVEGAERVPAEGGEGVGMNLIIDQPHLDHVAFSAVGIEALQDQARDDVGGGLTAGFHGGGVFDHDDVSHRWAGRLGGGCCRGRREAEGEQTEHGACDRQGRAEWNLPGWSLVESPSGT